MNERTPDQPASAQPLLRARNVSVSHGKAIAVRAVSLDLRGGEIVSIVGPNGAGKTSLLAGLMGLLPVEGEVTWFESNLSPRAGTQVLVRAGLGLIPEKRELFGPMSVADNLALGAFTRSGAGDIPQTLEEVYTLFPRLQERKRQAARTLSGGERQMLAMGRALMARPRVLMLDEPSLGLAPTIVADVFRIIETLRARGVAVLLVEQNARAALAISDRAYVMEIGAFVLEGPARTLAADPRVIAMYLGAALNLVA